MALRTFLVDPTASTRLGEQGLSELTQHLHMHDCQTCDQPMSEGEPPSLVVEDFATTIQGVLHHPTCRAPDFTMRDELPEPREADVGNVSYSAYGGVIYNFEGRAPSFRLPYVVLNPHLEAAWITQTDGRWACDTVTRFVAHGMHRVEGPLRFRDVVPDSQAAISITPDNGYEVTVRLAGRWEWVLSPVPAGTAANIEQERGLFLVITTAIKPEVPGDHLLRIDKFCALLTSQQVAVGWVPVSRMMSSTVARDPGGLRTATPSSTVDLAGRTMSGMQHAGNDPRSVS